MFSTATKIQIAGLLSKSIIRSRALFGHRTSRVRCRRKSLTWDLDLAQGIDLQIFMLGQFEPLTAKALSRYTKPDSVIFDLGANVGSHTLPMATQLITGKVYAFEPTEWAYSRLIKNIDLNPSVKSKIVPVQAVIGEPGGESPGGFYSSWDVVSLGQDSHPIHKGGFNSAANAKALTLDEFVEQEKIKKVDLVKMDVDGFEVKILRGAKNLLKTQRPVFVTEICPYVLQEQKTDISEFLEIFAQNKYEILPLISNVPIRESADQLRSRLSRGSINVRAIPK